MKHIKRKRSSLYLLISILLVSNLFVNINSNYSKESAEINKVTYLKNSAPQESKLYASGTVSVPTVPSALKAAATSYNSIKVTWNPVSGASGYELRRGTSSTFASSSTITTTSTSYIDANIQTGTTYYYQVRAYKMVGTSKVYSSYSAIVNTKTALASPTSVAVAPASYDSIKVSFGAVPGASGYELYRSTSSNGAYGSVIATTSTSYTNVGLTTGTNYFYKVRAYRTVGTTKVFSNYSAIVSTKPILAVSSSITAVVDSYNGVKTSWAVVSGANGYELYRSNSSNGTYSLVGSTTNTSYTNTGVTSGTTYYYKVRAYKVVSGAKVYGNFSSYCIVTASNKGYVNNPETKFDLKVRSAASTSGSIKGYLYNFEKICILGTVVDASGTKWDKITYNGKTAYVSDAYIRLYSVPADSVVKVTSNITRQFESASGQIAGNFDGGGLSLGYLQWCIGQGTLQPLLNRMDRQYNSEMKQIFGTNYAKLHSAIQDGKLSDQLGFAKGINNKSNKIIEPWNTQFANLAKNPHFIAIEKDAEVNFSRQAMSICDKYKLRTVRGFALAFDIAVQNGSISSATAKTIDAALAKNPNMSEKTLLGIIGNAVADSSPSGLKDDIRARKMAIVNGQGKVHGSMYYLDKNYGLSDSNWR